MPVIVTHENVNAEATSGSGAVVTYTSPTTSDNIDIPGVATCLPASGDSFIIGNTVVTCNATDAAGNSATPTTFTVHVADTTIPIISLIGSSPVNLNVGTTYSDDGATASDNIDGNITANIVTANPVNTSLPGTYTVTYNVSDAHSNAATQVTRTVNVSDADVPVIASHENISADATSTLGAVVNYSLPTVNDNVDESVSVSCNPISGSTFAIGTTTVSCNASDAAGNNSFSSFNVTVSKLNQTISFDALGNKIYGDSDFTVTATASSGLDVAYSVGETDNCTITSNTIHITSTGSCTVTASQASNANYNQASNVSQKFNINPSFTKNETSLDFETKTNTDNSLSAITSTSAGLSLTTNGITMTATLAKDTIITGSSSWDGNLNLPVITTVFAPPVPDSGSFASVVSAIEMGSSATSLLFDKAVKIVFAGQAGKLVGWSSAGVFHLIVSVCDSATVPTLGAGADCKIDVSADLVVWTKHFTTFITYTQTANAPAVIGGAGLNVTTTNNSNYSVANNTPINNIQNNAPAASTVEESGQGLAVQINPAPVGQVLGIETFKFTKKLKKGSRGDEVTELQNRLTKEGIYSSKVDGKFGPLTHKGLIALQAKYKLKQDGVLGPKTRNVLNK